MPTNRTPLRRGRRLSPGRIKSLLEGPETLLIAAAGYFKCGCAQIDSLPADERQAAEAEMAEDWRLHREYLLGIWAGKVAYPGCNSKFFKIDRQPGPCWAERRFEARGKASDGN